MELNRRQCQSRTNLKKQIKNLVSEFQSNWHKPSIETGGTVNESLKAFKKEKYKNSTKYTEIINYKNGKLPFKCNFKSRSTINCLNFCLPTIIDFDNFHK